MFLPIYGSVLSASDKQIWEVILCNCLSLQISWLQFALWLQIFDESKKSHWFFSLFSCSSCCKTVVMISKQFTCWHWNPKSQTKHFSFNIVSSMLIPVVVFHSFFSSISYSILWIHHALFSWLLHGVIQHPLQYSDKAVFKRKPLLLVLTLLIIAGGKVFPCCS